MTPTRNFPVMAPPLQAGAGLKPEHVHEILGDAPGAVGFFEIHAENYMCKGGAPHAALGEIRRRFPLSIHGVGLSIGAPQPLDRTHLSRLKELVDRYEPFLVSEHLAWSTHDAIYFNDLLPVPYTPEVLARVVEHIDQVQSVLRRQILLENPSTYVAFDQSTMSEIDFISAMREKSGCALLLDLNNVYVSATNHGYRKAAYLEQFPTAHVREIHLAGHATEQDGSGNALLIDAHDRAVAEDVWSLYAQFLARKQPVPALPIPTLIEWDNDVPDWPTLKSEAQKADALVRAAAPRLQHAG